MRAFSRDKSLDIRETSLCHCGDIKNIIDILLIVFNLLF